MKILHMHRSLGAGGIEAMVCGLANEMSKTEDVTVCSIKGTVESDLYYSRLSSTVHRAAIGNAAKERHPIVAVFLIYRFIRKGHFDIVQLHGFFYFYLLAILLLHRRTAFYYTVHSDAVKENNPWDLKLFKVKRLFFKKRWLLPITISEASRDSFWRLYGLQSYVIPNGIARPHIAKENLIAPFRKSLSTRVFIHAGRICPEKNQPMLCRVFKKLIEEGYDISLVFAGPLHVQSVWEQMSPFMSDRILYLNERHDIPSLMYYSDGMCMVSLYEGLPIVLLEALSVGCIPVCTPVGGIVNVIEDHVNGFLSEDVSEKSYYQAMKTVLDMPPDKLKQIKEAAKISSHEYGIEKAASSYLFYYRQTVAGS